MLPFGGTWYSTLSKKEKLLWALVILAAFGALVYEWYLVIRGYVENPVHSNVYYKEPKVMRFPSLLFCHRQYYLNETRVGGNQNDQVNQQVAKYMRAVSNPTGADVVLSGASSTGIIFNSEQDQNKAQSEYLSYVAKFHNNPWAAFERVMLNCPGMVRQCSLGSQNFTAVACCQQWSVRRFTPVGPCLAFQPPDQEIATSIGAFQIDFDMPTNAYNNVPNFGGFDLYVGDMIGKPMSAALTLVDEDAYTVQITATKYENNIDHQCNRYLKSVFPQLDFVAMDHAMHCSAYAVRKLCQCDPVYKVELDAVASATDASNRARAGEIDSGSNYQISQGSYQFCDLNNILRCAGPLLNSTRDRSNFTRVAQRLLGYSPCDMRPPCVDNHYHFAVTEFRELTPTSNNYRSRLRIYYESFVLTEIDQVESYNFHHVVINMGGAVTFWLVAVGVLFYAISACKYCLHCGEKQDHGLINGFGRNKVIDIEVLPSSATAYPKPKPPLLLPMRKSLIRVDHDAETVEEVK